MSALLTTIQDEIQDALEALTYFDNLPIYTEKVGDIENKLLADLDQKSGIAIIILTPAANCNQPDVHGVYFDEIRVAVHVVENVTLNQSKGGTQKAAAAVIETVAANLHHYQLPVGETATDVVTMSLDSPTIALVPREDGLLNYVCNFRVHGGLELAS